jgi:hypothetical protein
MVASRCTKLYWKVTLPIKRLYRHSKWFRWCVDKISDPNDVNRGLLQQSPISQFFVESSDDDDVHSLIDSENITGDDVTLYNRLPVGWNQYMRDASKTKRFRRNAKRLTLGLFLMLIVGVIFSYIYEVGLYSSDDLGADDSHGDELGTHASIWYHAHIDLASYDSVDNLARDSRLNEPCRKLTYSEYATRMLDHDSSYVEDFEDEPHKNVGYARLIANLDIELLTHMMCHMAYDIHDQDRSRPMYITPKMLDVSELRVAYKTSDKELSEFETYDNYKIENVCIMAYIRPENIEDELEEEDGARSHDHSIRPYEGAINAPNGSFVHSTDIGIAAEDERRRYYVNRNESSKLYNTRSWWNNALYSHGKPGECVLYINPDISTPKDNAMDLSDNEQFEVIRSSMLVEQSASALADETSAEILFSSKIWKNAAIRHNIVLSETDPIFEAFFEDMFSDGTVRSSNTLDATATFDTIESSAEAQIVMNLMHGRWNIFDEIRRAMKSNI